MKIVIVGGVAGGASAAARARRLSENAEIIVIERGPEPSFANCGLPYYVGGVIADRRRLLVAPKARLMSWYGLDVRTRHEVKSIDRTAQKITVRNLDDGTSYEETYDKLILAPGAAPVRPPVPGANLPGVYTLRNLADADQLHDAVTAGARRAVVVGAGFIGIELVENLVDRGVETTLVELVDQILPPWDREMTVPVAEALVKNGVRLVTSCSAEAIESTGTELTVSVSTGEKLTADLVVLSVGVRPESGLARQAGLEIGPRGGIRVNEHMQTSDPDIYAVGDAIEVVEYVSG
ncbi:MAG TPA: CoA-disulfide reductase, partial [Planctomycetaceae bacterium]|nr:CoA-disulfide reductase [Planctomycetaceae bacterium]